MKLSLLYDLILRAGIAADPRREKSLIREYADTSVLYGNPDREIRKVMVGIDMEVPELLLADRIRKEKGLDLVIAHHPEGAAFAGLDNVMRLQVDLLMAAGIKPSVAQSMLDERRREVQRRLHGQNHMRAVDAARLLDMPFMCVHTPADNHVAQFLQGLFAKSKLSKVQDIVSLLLEVPEYQEAQAIGAGPRIIIGNPLRPVGRIFLEMTGGTEGPKEVYEKLYAGGVRTIVSMHLSEEHFKKVTEANLNVVVAGHISSDTLGLNLLLDIVEKHQKLSVVSCSGFRRIRRNEG